MGRDLGQRELVQAHSEGIELDLNDSLHEERRTIGANTWLNEEVDSKVLATVFDSLTVRAQSTSSTLGPRKVDYVSRHK